METNPVTVVEELIQSVWNDFRLECVPSLMHEDDAVEGRIAGLDRNPSRQMEWHPATGESVDVREAAFRRVNDGRIASGEFVAEALQLRTQLGQIPEPVWAGARLENHCSGA